VVSLGVFDSMPGLSLLLDFDEDFLLLDFFLTAGLGETSSSV
jgi:hypothetical protein